MSDDKKPGNGETAPTLGARAGDQESGARAPGAAPLDPNVPVPDKVALLGHAVWLMAHSQMHKMFYMQDIEWLLLPPIVQNQFRLWRDGLQPEGFATWGFLSDEVQERVASGVKRLQPGDWNSGPHLWLMDLVLPFGGQENAIADLRQVVFKGRPCKSLQVAPDGSGFKVIEL